MTDNIENPEGPQLSRIEKVKDHFARNKDRYIVGAVCFVVGAVITGVLDALHTEDQPTYDESASIDNAVNNNLGISYKPVINTSIYNYLERRGHPGNYIQDDETGETYASQNRAADVWGISKSAMTHHLNDPETYPHAGGRTFTKLGEASLREVGDEKAA